MIRKLILLILLISINSCSNKKADFPVKETSKKISEYLKNDEKDKFLALIENRSTEMPKHNNFDILKRLYQESEFFNTDPQPELVDKKNNMGQEVYRIPYYLKIDSLTGISKINLLLYFGPSDLFPNDKLSGFETEFEYNKELRREIFEDRFQEKFD